MAETETDFYKILNVDENSSIDEIKKQYRILALKYHPDKNNGDDQLFKILNNAYAVLTDVEKRQSYDTQRVKIRDKNNFSNLFQGLFEKTEEQQKVKIEVSFNDILYGCYKYFTVKTTVVCSVCNHTGISNPDKNAIQCRECFGKGVNPTMTFLSCMTCNGKGIFVLNNKKCNVCDGNKKITQYEEKNIYIKPGVPNNDIIKLSNNLILIIVHNYPKDTLTIDGMDVHVKVQITLLELLGGFRKHVSIGEEKFVILSKCVFDCNKVHIIPKKGINDIGALHIHFTLIIDTDNKLLKKLSNSVHTLCNKSSDDSFVLGDNEEIITIN